MVKKRWRGALIIGAVVGVLVLAGCSGDGEAVTGTSTGDADSAEAPETTSAPDTTAAPETTTTAASGGSGSETDGGSASAETEDDTMWGLIIIGVIAVIGIVVWFASRSGARHGAQEQTQEAAYGEDDVPPSPSSEAPPG